MGDGKYPVEVVSGVPVVAAPEEIDITGMDRVIPNFTSLDQALAQTSDDRPNGHRRPDGAPKGQRTERARRAARH